MTWGSWGAACRVTGIAAVLRVSPAGLVVAGALLALACGAGTRPSPEAATLNRTVVASYRFDDEIAGEQRALRARDRRILERTRLVISEHPCVSIAHLTVAVRAGRVVLGGNVRSQHEARTAVRLIASLRGVTAVESRLTVADPGRAEVDTELAQRVEDELEAHPELALARLRVEARDGRVHVAGTVPDSDMLDGVMAAAYRAVSPPIDFDVKLDPPPAEAPRFLWGELGAGEGGPHARGRQRSEGR